MASHQDKFSHSLLNIFIVSNDYRSDQRLVILRIESGIFLFSIDIHVYIMYVYRIESCGKKIVWRLFFSTTIPSEIFYYMTFFFFLMRGKIFKMSKTLPLHHKRVLIQCSVGFHLAYSFLIKLPESICSQSAIKKLDIFLQHDLLNIFI